MSVLKNLTQCTDAKPTREEYVDKWDGKVEAVNRYTETRTPHDKDTDKRTKVTHFINIRYDEKRETLKRVIAFVSKEYKADPNAVCKVNGVLWSPADLKVKNWSLKIDQVLEDHASAQALIRETNTQEQKAEV